MCLHAHEFHKNHLHYFTGLHTLLLLIFARLNFRDFRNVQQIAKLKTRENLFQTFSFVFFLLITYFWQNRENSVPRNMPVPFSRN